MVKKMQGRQKGPQGGAFIGQKKPRVVGFKSGTGLFLADGT